MLLFSVAFSCMCSVFSIHANEKLQYAFQKDAAKSNQQCIACHQQSQHDWQESDHAKAMAVADNSSVLGDFSNIEVEHYGQKAVFFIKEDLYHVTISYNDITHTYPIKYTFGHFPLQQYLIETELGKLQVVPFAWDSRAKSDGGQRWYHNYSEEKVSPTDRLHWRQPLQNWNGMCADCHSDGLVRKYNPAQNSFSSQFDNINVGCLSCHGDMAAHSNTNANKAKLDDIIARQNPTGKWLRSLGEKTAHWQGEKRDNTVMDGCFACHSLRTPLTDGIMAKTAFLDQFTPQLLLTPNYHVDGQIKEEVFVYGSFLQSKMYAAGVNCLDCHDKHTTKLKFEGNGTCLQCHSNEVYAEKSHHQHKENSAGAQCVNCHMPTNRYMGVDDRRDHSFKIPRPDLSQQYNTPNACVSCHSDKSNQWAVERLSAWHGKPQDLLVSKQRLIKLLNGQALSLEEHLSIISDEKLDVISRATAIQLLAYTTNSLKITQLSKFLTHTEPLIRLSAVMVATLLPTAEKAKHVSPLLQDKYRAIRVASARSLVTSDLSSEYQTLFAQAFKELIQANHINSWRGEGQINQGVLAIEMNNIAQAEKSFKKAIQIEPYFEAGYINLADIYRAQQKPYLVASVLASGIKNNPSSAVLHYAYGLHFVRQKKLDKAVSYFEKAMIKMPNNSQYAYTYILTLDSLGQSEKALEQLKILLMNYRDKAQLKELGLYLSQKLRLRSEYDWFMEQ